MRQRVQLARGLAGAPRAVMMDEPFGALDTQTRAAMQRLLIDTWRAHPTTIVFVTHDVDEALMLGDRVAVLGRAGQPLRAVIDVPAAAHEQLVTRQALRAEIIAALGSFMMQIPDLARHGPARLRCAGDRRRDRGHHGGTDRRRDTAPRCCCWRRRMCGTRAHWRWAWTASTTRSFPARPTPEDYVAEITRANDGIVNQRTIYQTATRGFAMVQRLERYGVKFEKDEHGEYAVRQVHRSGSYVLPMPEGKDVKKALYRVLRQRSMREKIRIENRLMPVRVLTEDGRAVGAAAFNTRTGEFVAVAPKR